MRSARPARPPRALRLRPAEGGRTAASGSSGRRRRASSTPCCRSSSSAASSRRAASSSTSGPTRRSTGSRPLGRRRSATGSNSPRLAVNRNPFELRVFFGKHLPPGAVRRDDRGAPRLTAARTSPSSRRSSRGSTPWASSYPYLTLLAGKENAKAAIRWAEQALADPGRARMRRIVLPTLAVALVAASAAGRRLPAEPAPPARRRLPAHRRHASSASPSRPTVACSTPTRAPATCGSCHCRRHRAGSASALPTSSRGRFGGRSSSAAAKPDARDRRAHPHGPPDRGEAPARVSFRRPGRAPGSAAR